MQLEPSQPSIRGIPCVFAGVKRPGRETLLCDFIEWTQSSFLPCYWMTQALPQRYLMLDWLGRAWFHLRYRPQIYLEAIWRQVAPKRQLTPNYKTSPCIRPQWIWRPLLSGVLEVAALHLFMRSAILRFSASAQCAQPNQVAGHINIQLPAISVWRLTSTIVVVPHR